MFDDAGVVSAAAGSVDRVQWMACRRLLAGRRAQSDCVSAVGVVVKFRMDGYACVDGRCVTSTRAKCGEMFATRTVRRCLDVVVVVRHNVRVNVVIIFAAVSNAASRCRGHDRFSRHVSHSEDAAGWLCGLGWGSTWERPTHTGRARQGVEVNVDVVWACTVGVFVGAFYCSWTA